MPILDKLLDRTQIQKALLQDRVVRVLFTTTKKIVLHGGTVVWRCYGGERFSKDLDIYVSKELEVMKTLNRLSQAGIAWSLIQKRKTGFGLYYNYVVTSGGVDIALQITMKKAEGSLSRYGTVDGSYVNISALPADRLLLEKAEALLDRAKARDLYDMNS